ncbi:hypothetical protein CHELA40_15440 [Chelatococcus asaccharovorans]|nr:hypothetical protein CHELA40_15440 [Chelatococcus asaccharovorans]
MTLYQPAESQQTPVAVRKVAIAGPSRLCQSAHGSTQPSHLREGMVPPCVSLWTIRTGKFWRSCSPKGA